MSVEARVKKSSFKVFSKAYNRGVTSYLEWKSVPGAWGK